MSALLLLIPDWAKWLAVIAAATILSYQAGHWRGSDAGYDKRIAEVAASDAKAELERKGDDAKLQAMSDYDLCVAGLRSRGMPVDACEQLRGIRGE